jgi:aspartyl protease family protein
MKPGTVPLFSLPFTYDQNGFYLKWVNDTPDFFRKIKLAESDIVIKRYTSEKAVKMIQSQSGIFEIPATINNVLKIFLVLDTGASDVSISPDVALTLIKARAINKEDWLEGTYYKFADGSIAKSERFIIRYLKVGNFEIKDVVASISGSIDAPLLLGQSALSKLGKIQIDYKTQEFKIIN